VPSFMFFVFYCFSIPLTCTSCLLLDLYIYIYIHTHTHTYILNCLIDSMYISFISFFLCLLPCVFPFFLRNIPISGSNPHISEARDLRAVSCLSFFACSPGCKKVYGLRAVQRVQTTNVILRCLLVRGLGCWIAVCKFVVFIGPQMLVGDPLIHYCGIST
jgi:hypothetical protein